jgi:superfamily II DNA/RNA helicase
MLSAEYHVEAIHGKRKQGQRQKAIDQFLSGDVPILIATDLASRGLDFPNVSYVFNYDMPNNIDDYVHRIGRTGRCGNKGKAISFICENTKSVVNELLELLKKCGQEVPEWFLERVAPHIKKEVKNISNSNNLLQKKRPFAECNLNIIEEDQSNGKRAKVDAMVQTDRVESYYYYDFYNKNNENIIINNSMKEEPLLKGTKNIINSENMFINENKQKNTTSKENDNNFSKFKWNGHKPNGMGNININETTSVKK